MSKIKIVVVTLLLSTLSVTTLVYSSNDKKVTASIVTEEMKKNDAARVLKCVKENPTGDNDCLTEEMVSIALIRGPRYAFQAVINASRANPNILTDCHTSGHEVGRALYRESKDIKALLPDSVELCMGAYIHGVFDAWEKESPTLEEFASAAYECNKTPLSQHMSCYDGLAHVLWRVHSDYSSITNICSIASSEQGRTGCLGGVLMQMYAPAIGEATNNKKNIPYEIPKFCANLPEWDGLGFDEYLGSVTNPNVNAACFSNSSYSFRVYYIDPISTENFIKKESNNTPSKVLAEAIKGYLTSCSSIVNPNTPADKESVSECKRLIGGLIYMRDPVKLKNLSSRICNIYLKSKENEDCHTYIEDIKKNG